MAKELIEIKSVPQVPENWDYNESVEKVKTILYNWKNLTVEMLDELCVAREVLGVDAEERKRTTSGTFVPVDKTWTSYCQEIGSSRRVVNRWIRRYEEPKLSPKSETPLLPIGKFEIIYVDPPWEYSTTQHGGAGITDTGSSEAHYEVRTDEEICELEDKLGKKIEDIAAENCLLFMWTTGPKMDSSMKVGESWGFEYITMGFVWYKEKPNPGNYTMSECEYCLIFRRGKIPQPRGVMNMRQFLSEKRTEHSRKPAEIRNRITQMFPLQKKIELFAREKPEGWEAWGLEAK